MLTFKQNNSTVLQFLLLCLSAILCLLLFFYDLQIQTNGQLLCPTSSCLLYSSQCRVQVQLLTDNMSAKQKNVWHVDGMLYYLSLAGANNINKVCSLVVKNLDNKINAPFQALQDVHMNQYYATVTVYANPRWSHGLFKLCCWNK